MGRQVGHWDQARRGEASREGSIKRLEAMIYDVQLGGWTMLSENWADCTLRGIKHQIKFSFEIRGKRRN